MVSALTHWAIKLFLGWLSRWWNLFRTGWAFGDMPLNNCQNLIAGLAYKKTYSALTQSVIKSLQRWLSVRKKSFPRRLIQRILKFLERTWNSLTKMWFLTIRNRNFENPTMNPSNRTKMNISRKESIFSNIDQGHKRFCQKNAKISHACVPLMNLMGAIGRGGPRKSRLFWPFARCPLGPKKSMALTMDFPTSKSISPYKQQVH